MKLKQKKADSGPSKTSKEMHALLQKKKKRNDTGILKQEKTSGRKIIVAKLTE